MDTPVELIVGLGNPGPQYHRSRHNAGADFVSALARAHNVPLKFEKKFFGDTARLNLNGAEMRLLIPSTFMNLSGKSVVALAGFYQIAPGAILVAHDDLDLPPGTARLKIGGGHGGHNGLRDIIQSMANNRDFARLRIGIGHPGQAGEVVSYVLRKAPPEEQQQIDQSIEAATGIMPFLARGQWNAAMKALHTNR